MRHPRTPDQFERFVQKFKLRPVGKWPAPGGQEIMIADGFVSTLDPLFDDFFRNRYPNGLYQTAWGLYRPGGGFVLGSWCEFDRFHDWSWPDADRESGRVNAALEAAMAFVELYRKAS